MKTQFKMLGLSLALVMLTSMATYGKDLCECLTADFKYARDYTTNKCAVDFKAGIHNNCLSVDYKVIKAEWYFSDGTTATGKTVKHVFPKCGIYEVCVKLYVVAYVGDYKQKCELKVCKRVKVDDCYPCEWKQ